MNNPEKKNTPFSGADSNGTDGEKPEASPAQEPSGQQPDSPEENSDKPIQSEEFMAGEDMPVDDGAEHDSGNTNEVEQLKAQVAEAKDHMLRALADAENTRKRAIREREDGRKYAITDFARDLLDFADNFRRALDSIPADLKEGSDERIKNLMSGIEAMERDMLSTFEKHNIRRIDPIDEKFDPNYHEVMFEAPGTGKAPGIIIQVIEPGYILHDRLLRPARVGIAQDDGSYKGGSENGGPADPGSRIDEQI